MTNNSMNFERTHSIPCALALFLALFIFKKEPAWESVLEVPSFSVW